MALWRRLAAAEAAFDAADAAAAAAQAAVADAGAAAAAGMPATQVAYSRGYSGEEWREGEGVDGKRRQDTYLLYSYISRDQEIKRERGGK